MRLAIYTAIPAEANCLCRWAREYCAQRNMDGELVRAGSATGFREEIKSGRFDALVIAFGDTEGFLAARYARELDRDCRIALIDDSGRYAIRGYRLHLSDFLVRPVDRRRFFAALDKLFER